MESNSNSTANKHILSVTLFVVIIIVIIIIVSWDRIRTSITSYCSMKYNNDTKEYYDVRIPNISLTECGTECTKATNCVGFGFNHSTDKCYMSKKPIIGEPMYSLYSDEYTKLDRRCNKINNILDSKRIDGNTLTENSIYVCSDGENNVATQFQYANMGATSLERVDSTIFDRANSDAMTPTNVKYDTYEIIWPLHKIDLIPISARRKSDELITKNNFGFLESDKEFIGQHVLEHQCVVNVPMFDCLKFCENRKDCTGVEWNESLIEPDETGKYNYFYENVCCPKSTINKIVPRREKFNRGRFYIKKDLKDLINKDNLIFTKADDSIDLKNISDIPYISDVQLQIEVNDPRKQNFSHIRPLYDDLI
jgi:hypothetical protein